MSQKQLPPDRGGRAVQGGGAVAGAAVAVEQSSQLSRQGDMKYRHGRARKGSECGRKQKQFTGE